MLQFNTYEEAHAAFLADRQGHEDRGVSFPGAQSYLWEGARRDFNLAMDAQPLLTTDPNSSLPNILTTYVDLQQYEILFAPTRGGEILGERKTGDWLMDTYMFMQVEHTGEVSSYGDNMNNGGAGVNFNYPQRQNYLFQAIKQYGQRELERAGLAKLNWVAEKDRACASVLKRFENLMYFFGIAGLQNYGLLNDPNLTANLSPAPKAAGGTAWIQNGVVVATANEIFNDIQSIYLQAVIQGNGLIEKDMAMKLCMAPTTSVALTQTNSFNVNVEDLLKKNFPKMEIEIAPQYGVLSTANSQGIAAGNLVQLIIEEVDGQRTGFGAFSEKMKAFTIVKEMSAYKQKVMSGGWGMVLRQTFTIASMLGV